MGKQLNHRHVKTLLEETSSIDLCLAGGLAGGVMGKKTSKDTDNMNKDAILEKLKYSYHDVKVEVENMDAKDVIIETIGLIDNYMNDTDQDGRSAMEGFLLMMDVNKLKELANGFSCTRPHERTRGLQ